MRKHFLILMLMALLPLAGWAQDVEISAVTITFANADATSGPYTGTISALPTYTVNAKLDGGAAADLTEGTEFTGAWSAGTGNMTTFIPGTYTLTLTAADGYAFKAGETTTKEFTITKANITVSTPPTVNDAVNYDGTAKQVIATAGAATSPAASATLTFYYAVNTSGTAPGADDDDTWYASIADAALKVTNASTYHAYYKVVSDNANVNPFAPDEMVNTFIVNKVPATITTNPTAKTNLVYNAGAQALINAGATSTGTLKYSLDNGTWSEDIPEGTDADDYDVYYKVFGDANHTDFQPMTTGATPEPVTVEVNIAKKNLKAKPVAIPANVAIFGVLPQSGTIGLTNYLDVEYDGFAGADTKGSVFTGTYAAPTADFASTVKANDNCVTISGTKYIKAGEYAEGLEVSGGNAKNYEIVALNRDLNVAKAKVKVDLKAAVAANATYGTNAAKKTEWEITYANRAAKLNVYVQTGLNAQNQPTYSGAIGADDYAAYLNTYSVNEGTTAAPVWKTYFNNPIMTTRADESREVGEYLLSLSGAEETTNTVIISQTNSTDIKFAITEAVLIIKAGNKWKTYGTADPGLTYTVTSGGVAYTSLSKAQNDAIQDAMSRAQGETAGDYKISFAESVKTSDLFKDNYTITWTDGWMTIEKADLTIAAKPQTLYLGNKVNKLVQTDYTIEGLVNNPTLSIADAANVSLAFGTTTSATETAVPVSTAAGHEGELTTAAVYDKGIKIILANALALAANYNITLTNGELTVIDTNDGIVLNFAGDNTEALASANTKTIEVTFGNKTMVKDNWHTMVLPFDTTPLELSKLLNQYVVINRLSDNSTASHVAFELELNEIPAGEAFLIKSGADIVWDGLKFHAGVGGLGKKEISKDIVAEPKGGNKLVGVYATTSKQSTDDQMIAWLGNTAQKKADGVTPRENKWYEPYNDPKDIASFEAYLMYAPNVTARPMITVQDADGTVTAINEVKAGQFQEIKTDGWYTINGVKLEGAPTEKGIYINNGKKIVVK